MFILKLATKASSQLRASMGDWTRDETKQVKNSKGTTCKKELINNKSKWKKKCTCITIFHLVKCQVYVLK